MSNGENVNVRISRYNIGLSVDVLSAHRSEGRDNFFEVLIVTGDCQIPEVTVYFHNKLFIFKPYIMEPLCLSNRICPNVTMLRISPSALL